MRFSAKIKKKIKQNRRYYELFLFIIVKPLIVKIESQSKMVGEGPGNAART